jgi:hypothetical protein
MEKKKMDRSKRAGCTMASSAFRTSLAAAALCLALGQAQAAPPVDPFGEEVVAIRAKHIETVSKGVLDNAIILVRNGKITAIGKDVKIPFGATILMADTVMPGMVGIDSRIGLGAGGLADGAPAGPPRPGAAPFAGGARGVANPHFRVVDELYPFEPNYYRLARAGVTTLGLSPGGAAIAGQGAVVRPFGTTAEAMTVNPSALLSINFAANTQTIDLIRSTFEAVRPQIDDGSGDDGLDAFGAPFAAQAGAEAGDDNTQGRRQRGGGRAFAGPAGPATGSAEERRAPVLKAFNGTIPTFINCPDDASVSYALPLFQSFSTLKPVYILNAPDSYRIATALGAKKASVILNAVLVLEPLTTNRINLPAILAQAGAKIACRPPTDDVEGYRDLRFKMGELVKNGLDRQTALRAITLTPAEMLGVADRIGSIDVGRDGNLLLLSGDPLEAGSRLSKVLLEGKVVYDGD